jgi:hypothetical protein
MGIGGGERGWGGARGGEGELTGRSAGAEFFLALVLFICCVIDVQSDTDLVLRAGGGLIYMGEWNGREELLPFMEWFNIRAMVSSQAELLERVTIDEVIYREHTEERGKSLFYREEGKVRTGTGRGAGRRGRRNTQRTERRNLLIDHYISLFR